ncbi:MAG: ankyrin repeat domain-containing protein [Rickettsiales bacterium]|nr:ankyrin repeat domain-containing protein [Rickettsiales bacterium]
MSQMIEAARHGNIGAIRRIARNDPNAVNKPERFTGSTPLHIAVANKNEATSYVLLTETKADPTLKDAKGRRPLDIALETGNKKTAQMLFEATFAKGSLSIDPELKDTLLPKRAITAHAQRQADKDLGQGR